MAGSVTVHNVAEPEVNVTVPVASAGSPDTDRATELPYATDVGFAAAVSV